MINFLNQSRRLLKTKEPVCLVLGNESCDLDSAVSAISLAYFYHKNNNFKPKTASSCNFLPILNIPKRDYPLKTEVQYLFNKHRITHDMLTFRDELTEEFLDASQYVLVDHHVSPWSSKAVAIYDHRPKDITAKIPENCETNIHLVGSCATLIAELYLQHKRLGEEENEILDLLRSAIVLDTVNFSEAAARATPKDVQICAALEDNLKTLSTRENLFHSLVKARADVSNLSASELLRKDLKIITSNKDDKLKIAVPGFPLLVQDFILKPQAEESVQRFADEHNCVVILLLGMFVNGEDNTVHRDLGLIDINNSRLYNSIKDKLLSFKDPNMLLELYNDCKFMNGSFYKQGNIKATRKHMLPVVKGALDNN